MKISTVIEYLLGRNPLLKEEVNNWIRESDDNKREFIRLKELLAVKVMHDCSSEQSIEKAIHNIDVRLRRDNLKRRYVRYSTFLSCFAACLLILLVIGVNKYLVPEKHDIVFSNVNEEVAQYYLSDGTRIFLKNGAILSYNEDFNQKERDVCLKGEAYFEVSHNADIPFQVKTDQAVVRVLGTSFNVKAEDKTEVVLEKGRVALCDDSGTHYADLVPGNLAIVENNSIQISSINTSEYTRWRFNYKIYDRCAFDDFVGILENKYDVRFVYDSDIFKNTYFKLAITEDDTLDDILSMMEYIAQIKFEKKGNNIIITK